MIFVVNMVCIWLFINKCITTFCLSIILEVSGQAVHRGWTPCGSHPADKSRRVAWANPSPLHYISPFPPPTPTSTGSHPSSPCTWGHACCLHIRTQGTWLVVWLCKAHRHHWRTKSMVIPSETSHWLSIYNTGEIFNSFAWKSSVEIAVRVFDWFIEGWSDSVINY